jgi:hypothetical protein
MDGVMMPSPYKRAAPKMAPKRMALRIMGWG